MKGVGINMIKICEELKYCFYPSIDNYLKISKIQYPPRVFVYSNPLKLLVNLYNFLKRFLRNYIGGDEHVGLGECS